MNYSLTKIVSAFTKGYCNEAIDRFEPISLEVEPDSVINVLFKSKEALAALYVEGKQVLDTQYKKYPQLYYDFIDKKWSLTETTTGISLLHMGILMEDFKFVNEYNPYER